MKREVLEQFEQLFDLFTHKGWEIFLNDITTTLEPLKERVLFDPIYESDIFFKKGQIAVLRNISLYEETIRNQFEQLEAEEQESDNGSDDI